MKQRDQKKIAKHKPLKRKIHLSQKEVWSWEFRGRTIMIRTADHKTTYTRTPEDLTGISEEGFAEEFGYPFDWEEYEFRVTPKLILEEILKIHGQ